MVYEILYAVLSWVAAMVNAPEFRMTGETFAYWDDLYSLIGGPDDCTSDLDRVHQARYVTLWALNIIMRALGAHGDTFAACEIAP